MNFLSCMNVVIFFVILVLLAKILPCQWSLSKKVFSGLVLGILLGLVLQLVYGVDHPSVQMAIPWFDIVGNGYVQLLKMVIMPLVFSSILSAVVRLHQASSLGKISLFSIGTLLVTTAIAALIAILWTNFFGLNSAGLIQGERESARLAEIHNHYLGELSQLSVPQLLLSFFPQNPFADLTGGRATSIIGVVIFASFLGIAALQLCKENHERGMSIYHAIESLQVWTIKLVRLVMKLTPYGVLALMLKMVASAHLREIVQLFNFIVVSYLAIISMFVVQALILCMVGINPLRFFKKAGSVLMFAFTSRSSAASIPLNIEAQVKRIGIPESIAGFSASFGATIGQNGCAGIYPAMLSVMVAASIGINTLDPVWIMTLVGVVVLSSAGVAGVGGGATFAALIVLPAMGLPIELVALLISIEPLIDMGRTALNVSGSMLAGTVTSQLTRQTDLQVFKQDKD